MGSPVSTIKSLIQKESFSPSALLGMILNPFYFTRRNLDSAVHRVAPKLKGRLLDVGCGTKPYQKYFSVDSYVGMEVAAVRDRLGDQVEVYYSGEEFPFDSDSFDSVVSFQVLEHVRDPAHFVREIHRVLKPGGVVLLTVPFAWEEHETPWDFTRFTSFGLCQLFEKNGFVVQEQNKLTSGVKAIAQLFSGMLFVSLSSRSGWIRYGIQVLLIFPFHLFMAVIALVLPKSEKIFLDNLILAKKPGAS